MKTEIRDGDDLRMIFGDSNDGIEDELEIQN